MLISQLEKIGILNPSEVLYNPSYEQLFKEETTSNLTGFEKVQVGFTLKINAELYIVLKCALHHV